MIKKLPYALPFLAAVFTVVTLYQANAERLSPGTMVYPAVFALGIAGLFLFLAWLNPLTSKAAPVVAAVFTGVFLLWYTMPWWIAVIILAGTVIVCKINPDRDKLQPLTIIIMILVIIGIPVSGIQAAIIHSGKNSSPVAESYQYEPGQPNIYFIVPDRMPSPAAMRESGINPDQAITSLRNLGFYVPEDKRSADLYTLDYPNKVHTTRTMRFFASVLNDGSTVPTEIGYQDCRTMIRDNTIFTTLHDQGYQVLNYASWFTETSRFTSADKNVIYGNVNIFERFIQNELGEAYLDRTLLRGLPLRTLFDNTDMERSRHTWQASNILDIASGDYTSTFVISHIMLPHEPYVYAESGLSTQEKYYANIEYALTYLTDLAENIRAQDPTSIIIIQSDEGMAYSKPPEINRDLSPVQWSGVFSAWYFPQGHQVNTNLADLAFTGILDVVIGSK